MRVIDGSLGLNPPSPGRNSEGLCGVLLWLNCDVPFHSTECAFAAHTSIPHSLSCVCMYSIHVFMYSCNTTSNAFISIHVWPSRPTLEYIEGCEKQHTQPRNPLSMSSRVQPQRLFSYAQPQRLWWAGWLRRLSRR